jgi:hypothetical protein
MKMPAIALCLAAGLAAPASAMSVAQFLDKANALKAKGMMAMFSSDITLLKNEVMAGSKAWRAQIAPPGRAPNACPPPGPQKMSSDDILAMMNAVPPAQRATVSTSEAMTAGLNRRYPCHG